MFTPGRIIFASVFLLVFVVALVWSYRKELKINRVHYKKAYLILVGLILFIVLQYFIVKIVRGS